MSDDPAEKVFVSQEALSDNWLASGYGATRASADAGALAAIAAAGV